VTTDKDEPVGRPRRQRRWLRWLRDIVLVVVVVAAVQWWQSRDLVRDAAPPLVGVLLDGTPVSLTQMDGPVLVYFWADWCPICRFAEDGIARLATRFPVITIATSSGGAEDVSAYLAGQALALPVLVDERGIVARRWGVSGVPASFIVDDTGTIVHASRGYSSEYGLWLRLWWTGLTG
jgi:thiol-disulfide isomerase/thioredoxin